MTEYHTKYERPEGESSQWEDIHRKLGNFAPAEPVWKPEPFTPAQDEVKDRRWVDDQEADDLQEAEDDFADDQFLETYRQRRLQELSRSAKQLKFGSILHITKDQFVEEVTKASDTAWVVVFLYKDKVADCAQLKHCLEKLAQACPTTKFVKIISTDCIPSYPDQNLPTLLLYKDGQVRKHLVGMAMFGGSRATPAGVAVVLNAFGDVLPPEEVMSAPG